MEKCCWVVSANASYQKADFTGRPRTVKDLAMLTGVSISHSTLQRFVQREDWSEVEIAEPIQELSLDGGMIRLRTDFSGRPRTVEGQPGEWREYKALNVHEQGSVAFFKDNQGLLEWVNAQPLGAQFTGLGDGHDGVWNIFSGIGTPEQRIEVLDWYHLMENANKVQGTPAQSDFSGRPRTVQIRFFGPSADRALLWRGETQRAISYLRQQQCRGATGLINYLKHHQTRIIDYQASPPGVGPLRERAGSSALDWLWSG